MSVIVIKYGGSLMDDSSKQKIFLNEIAREWKIGRNQIALVHGGGKEISRQMEKVGLQPKFIKGRRHTDAKTMEVVEKALRDLNESIVLQMKTFGVEARGYSGKENHWMKTSVVKELGQVGIPTSADYHQVLPFIKSVYLPVFYSVGEDENGQTLNINADDFAMVLAIGLGADELIFLTDTGGVLNKSGKLISQINRSGADSLMLDGTITGGMGVKIQACFEALSSGVGKVIIGQTILSNEQGLHVQNGTAIVKEGPTVNTI